MRLKEGIFQSPLSKFPHRWGAAKSNPSHGVTHTGAEVCTASFPGGMGELGCADLEVPTAIATWRWPTCAFWVAWIIAPVSWVARWVSVSSKAAHPSAWLWEKANDPKELPARISLAQHSTSHFSRSPGASLEYMSSGFHPGRLLW